MKFWKFAIVLVLCASATASMAAKVVLGKLGQTVKATGIYASATSRSRVYYRARPYEYLVLRTSKTKSWYRVLLQNGMFGYVKAETVACLPYEVTTEPPKHPNLAFPGGGSQDARTKMAQYSLNFIGTPYVWGGNDPTRGIDCSGFVKKLYGAIGLNLPRVADDQAKVGTRITRLEDLRPGDRLYFWSASRGKIGHTGIYIGRGYFVHSSSGRGGVATDYLGSKKWLKTLVRAMR
jgi:cell wall-associated NlpC family hydrolase